MKNLKSYIEEGLLKGMDQTLAAGESDYEATMDIATVPTVKDFIKNPWNKNWYGFAWYCPNRLEKYKKLYPDICPSWATSIWFVLDNEYKPVDLNIFLGENNTDFKCKKSSVPGWNDGLIGSNITTYKKMAIQVIDKLARNSEKLDEVMRYANEVRHYYHTHKGVYDKPLKSLLRI